MSLVLPKEMRDRIRSLVWSRADALGWQRRSVLERAVWYENWAKDQEIGGVLAHFMDPRKVRVYIKDTLLKPYQRRHLNDGFQRVLGAVEIDLASISTRESFSQPHGRLLDDGRVVCWGNGRDWKAVVFSVFERSFNRAALPFAAALLENGRTIEPNVRTMAEEAGRRLGLKKVVWLP